MRLRALKGVPTIQMYGYWRLALDLGVRAGELLGLRRSCVDLDERRLVIREQLQRRRGTGSTKGKKKGQGENLRLLPLKTKTSRRVPAPAVTGEVMPSTGYAA